MSPNSIKFFLSKPNWFFVFLRLKILDPVLTPVTPTTTFNEPITDTDEDTASADWELPEIQYNGYSYHSKSHIPNSQSLTFIPKYSTAHNSDHVDPADIIVRKMTVNNNAKSLKTMELKKSISVTQKQKVVYQVPQDLVWALFPILYPLLNCKHL